ncbi:MAG TPA: carbamoyltransferase HypF [Nitrospirae bacterium]|nr:carbamoyltransferase HypF [Nitrospirota bacterium]
MRLKIKITGLVQGVGFRPFIYNLATGLGLSGYVLNDNLGVTVEAEGEKEKLHEFLTRIDQDKPPLSKIYSLQHTFLENSGHTDFQIRQSEDRGDKKAYILPDIAACGDCIRDINTPSDRRYMYPFTNCTNCGPRFTIIHALPYDRKNTSMNVFKMCPDCEAEYSMPSDRRFHAQPDACHACGPFVSLYNSEGKLICEKEKAIEKTANLINSGQIIAVKGIGGFHLVCDASDKEAVYRLRKRKFREEKPMAVMFPDLSYVKRAAHVSPLEERALSSIERPIVILNKKTTAVIADTVSPDNSSVGAFLPYTPLHHIILDKLKKPVVATSANLTDEPIVKDQSDAFIRLSAIADYVLSNNRDIVRRCDDSVVRILAERQVPVRRSRGFAPLSVTVPFRFKKPVLALGPYMNNTIAIGLDDKVFLSQHIGDLDTPLAEEFFNETVQDLLRLLDIDPEIVVSDLHPGYYSTKFGKKHFKDKLVMVQHHFAHLLSCMAENEIPVDTEVIGFTFDGTGYGTDKTVWGGEVLLASYKRFKRAMHLAPFRLPGGDKAVKEPLRTAFSLLFETFGENAAEIDLLPVSKDEKMFFSGMIRNEVHSPLTTSMGRLFDGVSSLLGFNHKASYNAQAAIALEQAALRSGETGSYLFLIKDGNIDFRPVIAEIVSDIRAEISKEDIAGKFHNTIVEIIVSVSEQLRTETGIGTVALSGGVFQNAILLKKSFNKLQDKGFTVLIHQLVPSNDGGISLGQAVYGHYM